MTDLPEWAKSMIAPTAIAMCRACGFDPYETMPNDGPRWGYYVPGATAALAVALPLIAEHMAGVAERYPSLEYADIPVIRGIAAAIRRESKTKNAE